MILSAYQLASYSVTLGISCRGELRGVSDVKLVSLHLFQIQIACNSNRKEITMWGLPNQKKRAKWKYFKSGYKRNTVNYFLVLQILVWIKDKTNWVILEILTIDSQCLTLVLFLFSSWFGYLLWPAINQNYEPEIKKKMNILLRPIPAIIISFVGKCDNTDIHKR